MLQNDIDRANAEFWDELCGTTFARQLGITDHSLSSLSRFDQAYFDFYPYLLPLVAPERMQGSQVLEIGLGYGSLSQKFAEAGAGYTGLDLAAGPVRMVQHRLRLFDLPGQAVQGNSLDLPFPAERFDHVVSIGCFHHTGDAQRCFDETYRVLKPGGRAVIMVYNKFSFRQWLRWPFRTLKAVLRRAEAASTLQRHIYDANSAGHAAPQTTLHSVSELQQMLRRFQAVACQTRNCDPLGVRGFTFLPRCWLLTPLGRTLGLDIYVEATKPGAARLPLAA